MYCDQKWNVKKREFGKFVQRTTEERLDVVGSRVRRYVWTWNDSKAFDLTVLPRVSGHFHHFFTELLFNFPTKTFLRIETCQMSFVGFVEVSFMQ